VSRRLAASATLALVAFALPALPQESPNAQARRLLDDGRAYRAKGQLKQALENFNIITSSFPNSDSVDQALLEIGRYRMDVEGDAEKARSSFEQVAKQYPQSAGAPGAYYYLGLLSLNRAITAADLDDALAQFTRVQNLYPRSDWVPFALQGMGLVHRRAGRLADAVDTSRRVFLEYPSSDAAAAAQFQVGQCLALLGDPRGAMEEFQQVRNRFPQSEWAATALERTTALYRLFGTGKPTFALDPGFSVGAGDVLKDVRAVLMAPGGTFWIASEKAKSIVPYDAAGKASATLSAEEPRALSLTPKGEIVVAAKTAVRFGTRDLKSFAVPSDKPGAPPESLERILSAAVTPNGTVLVADEKRKKVYRYDAKWEYVGTFPEKDTKEREITRMFLDGEGGIVFFDREERTVRVLDETGKVLRTVGPAGLKKPVDAAVDNFRNTYVADEEGGVQVFNEKGQLLATLSVPEMRKPRALTLGPDGAVLVYDDRAEKVLRFR
jgi:TolA-binding protein/sugar lactone lactonase YvrE